VSFQQARSSAICAEKLGKIGGILLNISAENYVPTLCVAVLVFSLY
jgi:hypothetical protein